jgi:hypothetical protein
MACAVDVSPMKPSRGKLQGILAEASNGVRRFWFTHLADYLPEAHATGA